VFVCFLSFLRRTDCHGLVVELFCVLGKGEKKHYYYTVSRWFLRTIRCCDPPVVCVRSCPFFGFSYVFSIAKYRNLLLSIILFAVSQCFCMAVLLVCVRVIRLMSRSSYV
jgi:hypothetical protein